MHDPTEVGASKMSGHDPMCRMADRWDAARSVGEVRGACPSCEALRERDARVRADERERIATAIEAQRMDLSGHIATGELWIDGHYVGVLRRTDYRMMNAIRDMDARIARGGAQRPPARCTSSRWPPRSPAPSSAWACPWPCSSRPCAGSPG